jgi:hypothetical protein
MLLILVGASAWSQAFAPAQVPAAVARGMREKFPAVMTADWKLKSDKHYEADSVLEGIDDAAKFSASGKWPEPEYAISRSAVPKAVLDATAAKFKVYKITEIQQLERWNDMRPVFEIHVENAEEMVRIQFGADATILNQSAQRQPTNAKSILPPPEAESLRAYALRASAPQAPDTGLPSRSSTKGLAS